jgi:hypothetical protein
MAPLYTGTRANPFITGFNDVLEIGIRQDTLRQITAGTSNS